MKNRKQSLLFGFFVFTICEGNLKKKITNKKFKSFKNCFEKEIKEKRNYEHKKIFFHLLCIKNEKKKTIE